MEKVEVNIDIRELSVKALLKLGFKADNTFSYTKGETSIRIFVDDTLHSIFQKLLIAGYNKKASEIQSAINKTL